MSDGPDKPEGAVEAAPPVPEDGGRVCWCARCRSVQVVVAPQVIEAVKSWNRDLQKEVERQLSLGYKVPAEQRRYIGYDQIAVCDGCYLKHREELSRASHEEWETTRFYLKALRENTHTPDMITWLRERGHRADVDAIISARVKEDQRAARKRDKMQ